MTDEKLRLVLFPECQCSVEAALLCCGILFHALRNDLKCVEWDGKPCSIQSSLQPQKTPQSETLDMAFLCLRSDAELPQCHG